jgi:hypothetical protein
VSRHIQAGGPGNGFSRRAGCTVRCVFGGCDSERRAPAASALRRGQRLPPLSPHPFLRCAPDRFHLTKPNTFQHNREASVATLRGCSGSSRNAVRPPSEQRSASPESPMSALRTVFCQPFCQHEVPVSSVSAVLMCPRDARTRLKTQDIEKKIYTGDLTRMVS